MRIQLRNGERKGAGGYGIKNRGEKECSSEVNARKGRKGRKGREGEEIRGGEKGRGNDGHRKKGRGEN